MNSGRPSDVLAFGAHPDDLEAVMGGTAAKLVDKGRSLFVDLCDGEPARYAERGERERQSKEAARLAIARLVRLHRPQLVFTTAGARRPASGDRQPFRWAILASYRARVSCSQATGSSPQQPGGELQ